MLPPSGGPQLEDVEDALVDGDVPYQRGTAAAALRHRDFRIVYVGTFASNIGTWMQNVMLGAYGLALTHSGFYVGLLYFGQLGPLLFLSMIGGLLADRVDRRLAHRRSGPGGWTCVSAPVPAGRGMTRRWRKRWQRRGEIRFVFLALGLLVIATLSIFWMTRSRFGFGLIAIRENEEGAAVMGVNTTLYKTLAFALSGLFSALAGGIHAYWITFLDPESAFDISLNVKMIIMAVFGGPGTVLGPIVGAFSLSAVSEILSSEVTSIAGLFFGVVIVAAIVLMPRGLADIVRNVPKSGWRYFRQNIRAHRL